MTVLGRGLASKRPALSPETREGQGSLFSVLKAWASPQAVSLPALSEMGVPRSLRFFVQSHDMLYKTSRDILDTLRAGSSSPERL